MDESKIYVTHATMAEYQSHEPERLREGQLENDELYQLMAPNNGNGAEVYRANVYIRGIHTKLGSMVFGVVYTDRDLRPASKPHFSSMQNGYWRPELCLPLSGSFADGSATIGIFLPYEQDIDDEFRTMCEELSVFVPVRRMP